MGVAQPRMVRGPNSRWALAANPLTVASNPTQANPKEGEHCAFTSPGGTIVYTGRWHCPEMVGGMFCVGDGWQCRVTGSHLTSGARREGAAVPAMLRAARPGVPAPLRRTAALANPMPPWGWGLGAAAAGGAVKSADPFESLSRPSTRPIGQRPSVTGWDFDCPGGFTGEVEGRWAYCCPASSGEDEVLICKEIKAPEKPDVPPIPPRPPGPKRYRRRRGGFLRTIEGLITGRARR